MRHLIVQAVTILLIINNVCSAQILRQTADKVNETLDQLRPWPRYEEDRHPEFPTFEELLRDTTLFKLISGRANKYGNTFLLRSGLILTSDGPTLGLYSFEGKLVYRIPNTNDPDRIFVDSVGNIYCNHRKYLIPDYAKSIAFPFINVEDTFGRFQYECHFGGVESDSVDASCYDQKMKDFRRRWALPCLDSHNCQSSGFFGPHKGFLVDDKIGSPQASKFSLTSDTLSVVDRSVRIYQNKFAPLRWHVLYYDINYYALPNGMRCKTDQEPSVYRYQEKLYLLIGRGLYLML
jgi:hypothetical protein